MDDATSPARVLPIPDARRSTARRLHAYARCGIGVGRAAADAPLSASQAASSSMSAPGLRMMTWRELGKAIAAWRSNSENARETVSMVRPR